MLTFLFGAFYHKMRSLRAHIDLLEIIQKHPRRLADSTYDEFIESLEDLRVSCKELELHQSANHIDRILEHIKIHRDHVYLLIHLQDLQAGIRKEGEDHLSISIPPARGKLLQQSPGFWSDVHKAFPSASMDCTSAMMCYACDEGTASVFHSMRVLECGLKALSDALGLPFGSDVWHVTIDRIESEIRELERVWPKGQNKSEFLKFYSEAAKEFRYFKDGWRNYVSHRMSVYDGSQALSTMNHVRDFMQTISSRLSEFNQAPRAEKINVRRPAHRKIKASPAE
jgi:hypothetical protein